MSVTQTTPRVIEFPVAEKRAIGFDQAPGLPHGGSVSTVTVTLEPTGWTGTPVPLPTPSVRGTVVTVMFTGSDMEAGKSYRFTVQFNGGASAPVLTSVTTIEAVAD